MCFIRGRRREVSTTPRGRRHSQQSRESSNREQWHYMYLNCISCLCGYATYGRVDPKVKIITSHLWYHTRMKLVAGLNITLAFFCERGGKLSKTRSCFLSLRAGESEACAREGWVGDGGHARRSPICDAQANCHHQRVNDKRS